MSLGIAVLGTQGLVVACDSRLTVYTKKPDGRQTHVHFNNSHRLITFDKPHNHLSVITTGAPIIAGQPVRRMVEEYISTLQERPNTILEYATVLSNHFQHLVAYRHSPSHGVEKVIL